jgi:acyl-CoA synthetase (AMP-forming)/AMP-acid ligase II/acyl carrier protein
LTQGIEAALRAGGISPEGRVALVAANGPIAATAFFAIASSCAVAPLNPAYTAAEFEFYLRDLEVQLVVIEQGVSAAALEAARQLGVPVALLRPRADVVGGFSLELPAAPGGPATGQATASSLALLLHTSGTTSRPKLVALTQGNLVLSARSITETLGLGARDVCLNIMPLFHVHGLVACVLATWGSGGAVIASPGFSAVEFESWLERTRPTWISAVPTMFQAMLSRHPVKPRGAEQLRFLRTASSALPVAVEQGLERLFGVPVLQAYGMTEAAHQISSNPLPPGSRKPGSVGRPSAVEARILDAEGHGVVQGQRGEVCLRGPSLFAGYVANPEANRSSFFGEWFRTGDEGYLDEDGYLFLTGRLKEMINKGGEKVAPPEVEEALLSLPGVAQTAVFAMPDERLGEEVAAVVVPKQGAVLEETALRARVAERVSAHKVPRLIVIREEIPKGPTGKVQRRRLAEQLGITGAVKPAAVPGAGAAVQLSASLLQLASDVLQRPLRPDDDFFAAGGDSLAASRLLDRVATVFKVQVLPVEFFNSPTVSQLASVIEARVPGTGAPGPTA